MTIGIYGIYDKETGDCLYVGMSSVDVERRWRQHASHLANGTHKRKDFVSWFIERGSDISLLDFRVLEKCESETDTLNSAEIYWFIRESPRFYGKNPSVMERWAHSEETIHLIRTSNIGRSPSNLSLDPNNPRVKMEYRGGIWYLYTFTCSQCGKVFHRVKESKFCSVLCTNEYRKAMSKSEYDYDYIYDLYWTQGLSRPEVARKLGVGRTKALSIMKRLGIPRRTAQEGVALKNSS